MDIISVINLVNAQDCFANSSFLTNWNNHNYRSQILEHLGHAPLKSDIVALGDNLSKIFANDDTTRDQGNVSSAGNTWLRLVCWYFNLCLLGTRSYATLSTGLIPHSIRESLKLRFNGDSISGSKEIIIIEYAGDKTPTVALPSSETLNYRSVYMNIINDFLSEIEITNTRVIMVAAKTNCSDMVAVPLFWAFCYKGNKQDVFDIKVGSGMNRPESTIDGTLKYSLVTVPTGREELIEAGQLPGASTLKKLGLLDGGFYWGRPTNTTMKSVSEFCKDNLPLSTPYVGEAIAGAYQRIVSGESPMSILLNPSNTG